MSGRESAQPKTLADDLRSRTDDDVAAVFRARPDLLHPIPSDMRALTTRAATSPSIARYLDTVDAVHHYVLRIASEQTRTEPTNSDRIVEAVVATVDDPTIATYAEMAVENLRSAAVLWGSTDRMHVVTAVRDQVAAAPMPHWPPPACSGNELNDLLGDQLAHRGAANGAAIVAIVEEVLDLWSLDPGAVLRSGGLSSRSLESLADRMSTGKSLVRFAIDLAGSSGLVAHGATDTDIAWMPTRAFDSWCDLSAPQRWSELARGWMTRPVVTGDRALAPIEHAFTVTWREHLVDVAANADRTCDLKSIIEVIDYRWPRRRGSKRNEVLAELWREAEALGILVDGVITPAGRVLATSSTARATAAAIAPYLPDDISTVHVQADHTIVAPGPLAPSVARQLRALADVESRGHATVFRLTNQSLLRALTLDSDPATWRDFLAGINDKPLPQPIDYLLTDAGRKAPPSRSRHYAPDAPAPLRRPRVQATPARIDKALDVLRDRGRSSEETVVSDLAEIPKMESAAVVAGLRYAIDHHETVHLSHAESDGSTAALLVDPIRLGGGSLTAYDHRAEQVRTLAISRIIGVTAVQISA